MPIEIDQSGKVEDTRKLTVVCFANGKAKTLLINAKEKRKVLIVMREIDRPHKNFVFRIFAGLVFLLIKNEKVDSLIIDREYPGHEAVIRSILTSLFDKNKIKSPKVSFGEIGKKSKAHQEAIVVLRGKRKPDVIVKASDVLDIFLFNKRKPRH
ncbi:MAG: hypothetical protein PHY72_00635 [Candidatus Pacebacteria bacterium]|nr:hypothetical protein [Candidatus Paceibacterota bacterium]